ncbi:PDZ domain-containing protein [Candidatus Uhrbacteria bacterium]|nr:PDZ domain-containing protein [Candidatus Uhrbacteria bacterium]
MAGTRYSQLGSVVSGPFFFWLVIIGISGVSGFLGGVLVERSSLDSGGENIARPVIFKDRTRGDAGGAFINNGLVRTRASMLAVYDDARSVRSSDAIAALPVQESLRGYALALTTDGWLVTTIAMSVSPVSYRLITQEGDAYSVDKAIADPFLGITFIKIAAKNLDPIQFSKFEDDATDVRSGALLTGWNTAEQVVLGPALYSAPLASADYIHSTRILDKRMMPDRTFAVLCMPIISDTLDVVGCTASRGAVSFAYLQTALGSILQSGSVNRSTVTLRYIDLSQAPVLLGPADKPQFGALVQLDSSSQSLPTEDGLAERLSSGDIITHVNDEALDDLTNLTQLLSRYQKGDSVGLKIKSGDRSRDIRIKL